MGKSISSQIRNIRDKHKLSQERFGKKVGISGKTVSAYETGKTVPSMRVLEKLTDCYGETIGGINPKKKDDIATKIKGIKRSLEEIEGMLD